MKNSKQKMEMLLSQIKGFDEKIVIMPLKDTEIRKLEKVTKVKLPDYYILFLKKVGIFQDLLNYELFDVESLVVEKNFINRVVKKEPEIYFPFAANGSGDLFVITDRSKNDNYVYIIYHETGRVSRKKSTFYDIVAKAINKAIKNYKKLKPNDKKEWAVQFSFSTNDDSGIIELMKKFYKITYMSEWNYIDKSSAGVKEYNKIINTKKAEFVLSRLEYKKWDTHSYSFDFSEKVTNIKNKGSLIVKMKRAFNKKKELGFILVDYGIHNSA